MEEHTNNVLLWMFMVGQALRGLLLVRAQTTTVLKLVFKQSHDFITYMLLITTLENLRKFPTFLFYDNYNGLNCGRLYFRDPSMHLLILLRAQALMIEGLKTERKLYTRERHKKTSLLCYHFVLAVILIRTRRLWKLRSIV